METITLRQACPEDAEAVLEIYAPYIKNTNILYIKYYKFIIWCCNKQYSFKYYNFFRNVPCNIQL